MTAPNPARYDVRQCEEGYRVLDTFTQNFVVGIDGGIRPMLFRLKSVAEKECGTLNGAYARSWE